MLSSRNGSPAILGNYFSAKISLFFKYYRLFASGVAFGCIAGAIKTKKPQLIAPLWPIGIGYSFQYDAAYGSLMDRARLEAEAILLQKPDWLLMPGGMPSVDELSK